MTVPAQSPSGFNPNDPAFLENPFPFYALGRQFRPVMYHEGLGFFSAFKYEDVTAILRDQATWGSGPPDSEITPGMEPSMLGANPPRHTRLRSLVSQAFTPRMVEQLEPRIRAVANELLDAVAGQDRIDAVEALTYPLPVIMIAEILGVPPEDRADFKRWSDVVVSTLGTGLGEEAREPAEDIIREFQEYLGRLIEDRRANPRNDLTSALVAAEEEGSKLTYAELIQMLILLLVAGNETTTNLIGNAILEFIAHPAELEKLRANPALMPTAIEEVLRFSSPVQATVRRAMRTTTLRGHDVAEGQQCVVWLASANRDADQFPDPDTFDITRTPNRHVSFGLGIHFCLGAPLARLEARIAVETFLNRYKSFARADDSLLPRVPTFIMHGVRTLPLVVE